MTSSETWQFDNAFLLAADAVLDLVSQDAVEAKWAEPSALERMSVGALACHLTAQILRADELLVPGAAGEGAGSQTGTDAPITAYEHYQRADWVRATSLDDPSMDRSSDDEAAAQGFVACISRGLAAHHSVRNRLEAGEAADVVYVPWQGWSLRRDQFLLTRLVEIVVHLDDLAASVGTEVESELPLEVFGPVRDLLVRLAEERHGRTALLRALTRAERAGNVSAF